MTGHSRLHRKEQAGRFAIFFDLGRHNRSRAYEAHIPSEHIEKLRQLVQARCPKRVPKSSDTRILALREFKVVRNILLIQSWRACERLLGVRYHRSKFKQGKRITL